MADLKKVFAPKEKSMGVTMVPVMLGSMVLKFTLPMQIIDKINKSYDKRLSELPAHNTELAGKIADEKRVNTILNEEMQKTFQTCFDKYVEMRGQTKWDCVPGPCWINEMKSGEYNPTHFHTSIGSDMGLSSVLMLKRPDWYGVEASREEKPANGWLEFSGGDQSPLSISQTRVDAQVGEFYVFPYTLLHTVYPFNSTDEVRRTMSYNCDLIRKKGR